MSDYLIECTVLLMRWLHVVAAIAWIGESFYFVALDRGLKPAKHFMPGLSGESWSVHGGGFYHKQKYLPAPPEMPEILHWSKWKSYTTWLSGFALFTLIYLWSPNLYLIDPKVADLSSSQAIVLALIFPVAGWFIYDQTCRWIGLPSDSSKYRDELLGAVLALLVLALSYAATHLFAGRAAFLVVGAVLATIMSANVFFVIIPGQKRMVADLMQGNIPDPTPGQQGKQRSVHNTYFTLPVVFAMLSNHYATAYSHSYSWLILAAFMAAGALIRQFFVLWHSGSRAWWLLSVGGSLLVGVFVWLTPKSLTSTAISSIAATNNPEAVIVAADSHSVNELDNLPNPDTASILPVITKHCALCHSAQPKMMASAPKGAIFDTITQVEANAVLIHQQAVVLKIMPPGNLTQITDDERALIGRWFQRQEN